MTELRFHGGAREVGRSCIQVIGESCRLLLDCGVKITSKDSEYPIEMDDLEDITAVFISHAHLDHTGALPYYDHNGLSCPIFATQGTRNLTKLLLKDAFKIGRINHTKLGYDELDIKKVLKCINRIKIDAEGEYKGIRYQFFDAGHIPGSAAVMVEVDGKKILYTGDINTDETRLLYPAEASFPEDIDVMICESTYGDRDHPNRMKVENDFIESVEKVLVEGGSVLVPCFAVGRSQELLLLLARKNFRFPVYIDGMGVEAAEIMLENAEDLKDDDVLFDALKSVIVVKGSGMRRKAVTNPSVIITTSGMLSGGPVVNYLRDMHDDPKHAVFLTGYQAEGTNGRMLMEKGSVIIDGATTKVHCQVKQFDFSAHAGMSQLKSLVRQVRPNQIFFVHGDEKSVRNLVEWASALGMDAYAPLLGQTFKIEKR